MKRRLQQDIDSDPDFSHPEQSILSLLSCLRLLGERYPKNLRVHFGRQDLEEAKKNFYTWYERAGSKVPKKYRGELLQEAKLEFARFEKLVSG